MTKRLSMLALCGLLSTGLTGCDDDTTEAETDAADTDAGETAADDMCDPIGANPAQGNLFNAPVEADVEVIDKPPTHPGEPGPTDLP